MGSQTLFFQLFENESSTYTYLIADSLSREAAIIDPVLEMLRRDLDLIKKHQLKLKYILDTHIHADHVTGAGELRKATGALTGVSRDANVPCVDMALVDGQELFLGARKIKVIGTPGHTDSCMSFLFDDRVFTGDALLINGCGRTDFQQGCPEKLYNSVNTKLFALPEQTKVFPGHDYKGQTYSTIENEKKANPRLGNGKSVQEFIRIMSELQLAHPKKMHEAIPANLGCGIKA